MGGKRTSGFTIIETLLFFALSGAMILGVLGGAGYAINVQRYREATTSLVSHLKSQYDQTINIQNNRNPNLTCSVPVGVRDGGIHNRPLGMTECAIVGRFMQTTDGMTITSTPVYADARKTTATNDIDSLVQAGVFTNTSLVATDHYTLPWGTRLVQAGSDTVYAPLNILIVRAPASGAVMTFIGNGSGDTPASLVASAHTSRQRAIICLDSMGLFSGQRSGAIVSRDAANSSGVRAITGDEC